MDSQTRHQARHAATGDVHAEAGLIRQQLRSMTYPGVGPRETECHAWEEGERACSHWCQLAEDTGPDPVYPCKHCNGTGTLPSDPRDAVRLMAYWGCEASRLVEPLTDGSWPENPCCCRVAPCRDDCTDPKQPAVLATGLLRLASKLPPLRLVGGVECEDGHHQEMYAGMRVLCACKGTGRKQFVVPMDRWVAVRVAVQVAEACLPRHESKLGLVAKSVKRSHGRGRATKLVPHKQGLINRTDARSEDYAPRRAIDAARRWLLCPCPSSKSGLPDIRAARGLPEWADFATLLLNPLGDEDHYWRVQLKRKITAAQSLIGEPAVRQAILESRP